MQWSFGVTCWEVFSGGKNPYPGVSPMGLVEVLERGDRLAKPMNAACPDSMYNLMKLCWKEDPNDRPSFTTIKSELDKFLETMAGYLVFDFSLFPEIQIEPAPERKVGRKRSNTHDVHMQVAEGLGIPDPKEQFNLTTHL